jgi:hypothetical protein
MLKKLQASVVAIVTMFIGYVALLALHLVKYTLGSVIELKRELVIIWKE